MSQILTPIEPKRGGPSQCAILCLGGAPMGILQYSTHLQTLYGRC